MTNIYNNYDASQIHTICENLLSLGKRNKEHILFKKDIKGGFAPFCVRKSRSMCSKFYKPKERRIGNVFDQLLKFIEENKEKIVDIRYQARNIAALQHIVEHFSDKKNLPVWRLRNIINSISCLHKDKINELKENEKRLDSQIKEEIQKGEKAAILEKDKALEVRKQFEQNIVTVPLTRFVGGTFNDTIRPDVLTRMQLKNIPGEITLKFRNKKYIMHANYLKSFSTKEIASGKEYNFTEFDCNFDIYDYFFGLRELNSLVDIVVALHITDKFHLSYKFQDTKKLFEKRIQEIDSIQELSAILYLLSIKKFGSDSLINCIDDRISEITKDFSVQQHIENFNKLYEEFLIFQYITNSKEIRELPIHLKDLFNILLSEIPPKKLKQAFSDIYNTPFFKEFYKKLNNIQDFIIEAEFIVLFLKMHFPPQTQGNATSISKIKDLAEKGDEISVNRIKDLAEKYRRRNFRYEIAEYYLKNDDVESGVTIFLELWDDEVFDENLMPFLNETDVLPKPLLEFLEKELDEVTSARISSASDKVKLIIYEALYRFFLYYHNGRFVAKDLNKAYVYFKKIRELFPSFEPDKVLAYFQYFPLELINEDALKKDIVARGYLITAFLNNFDIHMKVPERADEWLKEELRSNQSKKDELCFLMGIMYSLGVGVPVDKKMGVNLIERFFSFYCDRRHYILPPDFLKTVFAIFGRYEIEISESYELMIINFLYYVPEIMFHSNYSQKSPLLCIQKHAKNANAAISAKALFLIGLHFFTIGNGGEAKRKWEEAVKIAAKYNNNFKEQLEAKIKTYKM